MPVDLNDAETGGIDLFFADDLSGETFMLRDAAVYDADEVRDEIGGDVPKFGRWMPVHMATSDGQTEGSGWVVAVGELIEELQTVRADPVEVPFTVTRCEKSGSGQTDPYEVNVEQHHDLDEDQSSL
jgi:hypothetical protein